MLPLREQPRNILRNDWHLKTPKRYVRHQTQSAPWRDGRHNSSSISGGFVEVGRDFCQETSIHGFNHLSAERRHWFERLLWLAVTCGACWGAVSISLDQWQRYNENPTVVALDKEFRTWPFPLMSITACFSKKVNSKKLPQVIKSYWNVEPDNEKYNYYKGFVETVANSDLLNLKGFERYADDPDLEVDMYQLAVEVVNSFSGKAKWVNDMSSHWFPIMTEMGICYNTNSVAVADVLIHKAHINETKDFPLMCKFVDYSCFVIFEGTINMTLYYHSPYDVADVNSHGYTLYKSLSVRSDMSMIASSCGSGVRDLLLRRRRCLYTDENPAPRKEVFQCLEHEPTPLTLKYLLALTMYGKKSVPSVGIYRNYANVELECWFVLEVYSSNMCHRTCRNDFAVQECGCKPFYNNYEDGEPCTPAGMWCIARMPHNWRSIKCSCALQCDDAVYQELNYFQQIWPGAFATQYNVKMSIKAPRARYTREIVFHFQDLIVSLGGAAGLFLGASFLSFVEIGYFIIERLFKACAKCGGDGEENSRENRDIMIRRNPKPDEDRPINDIDYLKIPRNQGVRRL